MLDQYKRNINYMRISVTELCNLRCRYCMPVEGICKKEHKEMLSEDELVQAVEAAVSLGITKLRITGGEPLVKRNILSICRRIAAVNGIREVCMTTDGILLPALAVPLREAGVTRLNISLDTLDRKKYAYITRGGALDDAWAGIEAALSAGFQKVKLNAVLIGGFNDEEIAALAELTKRYPLDVRFIEMMPMYNSGDFDETAFLPCEKVLEVLPELAAVEPDGGVAQLYQLPGAMGRVGLIRPVNAHFCGSCNRIRLTADGKIKPCLHSAEEYNIKGLDFTGMRSVMEQAIQRKPEWHGEMSFKKRSHAGRNMNQIGG